MPLSKLIVARANSLPVNCRCLAISESNANRVCGVGLFLAYVNPRLNPDFERQQYYRLDLEFYIPQLINYLIFHNDLKNQVLEYLIKDSSYVNFYFGHQVYFYLSSLTQTVV